MAMKAVESPLIVPLGEYSGGHGGDNIEFPAATARLLRRFPPVFK